MRPDFWVRVLCFAQGSADFGYAVKDPGGLMRAVLNIVKSRFAGEDTYRVYSGIFSACNVRVEPCLLYTSDAADD